MMPTPNSEKIEFAKSIATQLIETAPGGNWLNEFISFRSKIKQARINQFIDLLQNYFAAPSNKVYHFDLMSDEDFTDIFESVVLRVVQTKAITKIGRFKNILINQLRSNEPVCLLESFLDLTLKLHEKQIEILVEHLKLAEELGNQDILSLNNTIKLDVERDRKLMIDNKQNRFLEMQEKSDNFMKKRKAEYYNISSNEYEYFVQDLVSKSLLINSTIGGIGIRRYEVVEITSYGIEYLNFIRLDESE